MDVKTLSEREREKLTRKLVQVMSFCSAVSAGSFSLVRMHSQRT